MNSIGSTQDCQATLDYTVTYQLRAYFGASRHLPCEIIAEGLLAITMPFSAPLGSHWRDGSRETPLAPNGDNNRSLAGTTSPFALCV